MKEATLIIMAAGMGSRYGGLKQIDKITSEGEIIMDFSLYDAMMAGFKKVVFVIKEEMAKDFKAIIEPRAGKYLNVDYAFQKLDNIPAGFKVPDERVKPWGTAHAILSCKDKVDGPFVVINADDYYGPGAFNVMYDFLMENQKAYTFSMVGYQLKNTVTENGHVARGVCQVSEANYLENIVERTKIQKVNEDICYEDEKGDWIPLGEDTLVSMNFWGYSVDMMGELEKRFPEFLEQALKENPQKGEYLIPAVTDALIQEGKATVKVLKSTDRWYGVTYQEDKEDVVAALQSFKDKGLYPDKLWK